MLRHACSEGWEKEGKERGGRERRRREKPQKGWTTEAHEGQFQRAEVGMGVRYWRRAR